MNDIEKPVAKNKVQKVVMILKSKIIKSSIFTNDFKPKIKNHHNFSNDLKSKITKSVENHDFKIIDFDFGQSLTILVIANPRTPGSPKIPNLGTSGIGISRD